MLVVPITCALKDREDGLRLSAAGGVTAVPLTARLCGELVAESAISKVALRVPAAVGVKLTETVQLAPAANEVPQVLESGKSPACAPLIEIALMLRLLPPLLERFTTCAVLVLPITCALKDREDGLRLSAAADPASPVPDKPTIS